MQDAYRWWDALDEVTGITGERAPSPWDVLSLVGRNPGPEKVRLSPREVGLATSLGKGSVRMPLVLTDNSGGQMSPQTRLAMLQAAARTGCALRLVDPSADMVELAGELGVPLWVVLGPERTVEMVGAMGPADLVELQLTTVGPEGGLSRAVDPWDSKGSLSTAVDTVRSVAGGVPLVLDTGPVADRETLRQAVLSGADVVMVQGISRSSRMHPRKVGTDPLAAVAAMVRTVTRTKRPDGVEAPKLALSGGFKDGLEVTKAIALGADLVVMGTAPRIALGCTLCADCGPGECPKVGQGLRAEGGKPDWKMEANALVGYIERVADDVRNALAQMGCSSVGEAAPVHLEAYTYDAAAVTGAPLAGYGETLPMWLH
jgi:hypothetical protein